MRLEWEEKNKSLDLDPEYYHANTTWFSLELHWDIAAHIMVLFVIFQFWWIWISWAFFKPATQRAGLNALPLPYSYSKQPINKYPKYALSQPAKYSSYWNLLFLMSFFKPFCPQFTLVRISESGTLRSGSLIVNSAQQQIPPFKRPVPSPGCLPWGFPVSKGLKMVILEHEMIRKYFSNLFLSNQCIL